MNIYMIDRIKHI